MPEDNKIEDRSVWPPPPTVPDRSREQEAASLPPRHSCLTAWLGLVLARHSLFFVMNLLRYPRIHQPTLASTLFINGLFIAGGIAVIACTVALLRGRRWGFYGLVTLTVLFIVVRFAIGLGPGWGLVDLFDVLLLSVLLNLAGRDSAWRYMK